MSSPAAASPTGHRPYNTALLASFVVISAAGLYFMRIGPSMNDAPRGFLDTLKAGVHPNGLSVKKTYTGIGPVDEFLSLLVTAFMPGVAGWSEPFYWQQVHFLIQLTPLLAVMNVEACRERNQGSWLKYTGLFAFLYQNIGGCFIIPIWSLLLHKASGRNHYFSTGRTVPVEYARVILPSTLLIFFVPTVAQYIPEFWSWEALQNLNAFWQWTPVLVNVPLWLVSPTVSSSKTAASKKADLPHLKIMYNFLLVLSIIAHMFTIFKIVSSETPGVSLWSVFLPNPAEWLSSAEAGLLWMFQWDWIFCALSAYLIPCAIAIYDVVRFIPETDTDPLHDRIFKGLYIPAALTVLGGPGAALVGIWAWREEQMVIIEERMASSRKAQ